MVGCPAISAISLQFPAISFDGELDFSETEKEFTAMFDDELDDLIEENTGF